MDYNDYINFGYSLIPEEEFARYSDMAEKTARRFVNYKPEDISNISEDNKRGICEIADILYAEHNQLNRPIAGFANEKYREQYFQGTRLNPSEKVWEILSIYFTHEQLYRGV